MPVGADRWTRKVSEPFDEPDTDKERTEVRRNTLTIAVIAVIAFIGIGSTIAFAAQAPKDASEATKAANAALLEALPFADKQSFEDAHRGFIAPLSDEVVKTQDGRPVWTPNSNRERRADGAHAYHPRAGLCGGAAARLRLQSDIDSLACPG
jgi:hypothetical protein